MRRLEILKHDGLTVLRAALVGEPPFLVVGELRDDDTGLFGLRFGMRRTAIHADMTLAEAVVLLDGDTELAQTCLATLAEAERRGDLRT